MSHNLFLFSSHSTSKPSERLWYHLQNALQNYCLSPDSLLSLPSKSPLSPSGMTSKSTYPDSLLLLLLPAICAPYAKQRDSLKYNAHHVTLLFKTPQKIIHALKIQTPSHNLYTSSKLSKKLSMPSKFKLHHMIYKPLQNHAVAYPSYHLHTHPLCSTIPNFPLPFTHTTLLP